MSPRASMDRDLNSSSNHDGRSRKRSSYEDRDDYYKHPREKRSRNYRHSPERYDENRERTYRKGRESSYREDRDDSHRQRSSRTYYENDNKDDRHGRYHSYSQHGNNRGTIRKSCCSLLSLQTVMLFDKFKVAFLVTMMIIRGACQEMPVLQERSRQEKL